MNETANMAPRGQSNKQTMPKEMKAKWLAALRSGEYKQGKGALRVEEDDGTISWCCMGALEEMLDGDVERNEEGRPKGFPTVGWMRFHGVDAEGIQDTFGENVWNPDVYDPIRGDDISLSMANDHLNYTFPQIADLIEAGIEGV